jgi:hypothetical protein
MVLMPFHMRATTYAEQFYLLGGDDKEQGV